MIQCKTAIKPCLVTVLHCADSGRQLAFDIDKISECCLLSDTYSPGMIFSFILGLAFVDFYSENVISTQH